LEAQMPYRTMGWIHANVARLLREERGQGTVEYVGLMLLLATLLTGVVAAAGGLRGGGIAQEIAGKLKETISSVGDSH
jgi:Flp pilus assembly pilin Flp